MTGYVWSGTGARTSVRSGLVRPRGHVFFWKGCGCRSLSIQIWLQAKIRDQGQPSKPTGYGDPRSRPIQTARSRSIQTCDQDLCPVVFKNILFPRLWLPKGLQGIKFVFEFTDYAFFFLKASGCSMFNALVLPSRWRQFMEFGHRLFYRWASLVYFAWRIIHKFVGPI